MDALVRTFAYQQNVELNYVEFACMFRRMDSRIERRLHKNWLRAYFRNAWRIGPTACLGLIALERYSEGAPLTSIALLFLAVAFWVFGQFFPNWSWRRYYLAIPDKNLLSVADADGVATTFNGVTKATTWIHIAALEADAYGIYLWSWTDEAFFFPRRGFDGAKEAQAFVDYVRKQSHVARPS